MTDEKNKDVRLNDRDKKIGRFLSMKTTDTTPAAGCPALEDIAAFIDNKLVNAEREAMVKHLAECRDCHEVFTASLKTQEELGRMSRTRVRRAFVYGLPAAMAAAVLLVIAIRFLSPQTAGTLAKKNEKPAVQPAAFASRMASMLVKQAGAGSIAVQTEKEQKTGFGYGGPQLSHSAFRAGVSLMDLELNLMANDVRRSQETLARVVVVLKGMEGSGQAQAFYEDMLAKIRQGDPPARFVNSSGPFQAYVDQKMIGVNIDLGIWTEALRVSAREWERGRPEIIVSFLRDPQEAERLLKDLKDKDVSPEVLTALKTLSRFSGNKQINKKELAAVLEQVDTIAQEMK